MMVLSPDNRGAGGHRSSHRHQLAEQGLAEPLAGTAHPRWAHPEPAADVRDVFVQQVRAPEPGVRIDVDDGLAGRSGLADVEGVNSSPPVIGAPVVFTLAKMRS
jgi:hypothetical protein